MVVMEGAQRTSMMPAGLFVSRKQFQRSFARFNVAGTQPLRYAAGHCPFSFDYGTGQDEHGIGVATAAPLSLTGGGHAAGFRGVRVALLAYRSTSFTWNSS
jgi:hypothetical protein